MLADANVVSIIRSEGRGPLLVRCHCGRRSEGKTMSSEQRFRRLVFELRRKLGDAETNARWEHLKNQDRKQKRRRLYKLVKTLPSVSVRMDGTKNHARPHLHLSIGKKRHAASIAIDNAEFLVGADALTGSQRSEVQNWVKLHNLALNRLWDAMQAGTPVDALICEIQEYIG